MKPVRGSTVGAVAIAVTAAGLGLFGCASSVPPGGDGGTGRDATGADATGGDAPPSSGPCPAAMPAPSSACTREGVVCQYGDDPRDACRAQFTCTSGQWAARAPGMCPPVSPPAMCPPSREAAAGQSCATMDQVCAYAGLGCRCTNCVNFPITRCTGPVVWQCDTPSAQPGCPAVLPNLGGACAPEGQRCTYNCEWQDEQGGRRCTNGVWVADFNACPISTRAAKRAIRYVDDVERERLAAELVRTRLATYEYALPGAGGERRLGFIIEDQPPGSFAVDRAGARVDLYGYTSMLVAAVQRQHAELAALRREVEALRAEQRASRRARPRPPSP